MIESTLQAISKTCRKCKEVKEISLFYKSKATRDGHESQCKKCRNAHTRKWRQETKEERTAWRRKYEQEKYERNRIYRVNIESTSQSNSKTCSKCKEVKDLSSFHKGRQYRDGYQPQCKKCVSVRRKEHYQENKEKIIARSKEWYQENKEQATVWRKKYEQENSEKIRIRKKHYRRRNEERISARSKIYNERDRGTMEYALRRLWYSAKTRANQKNLPFNLTVEWLETMVVTHCPITLEPLNWTREQVAGGGPRANSPSIDRIIPKLGYVQSNCAIISARANRIKNDGTIDEHLRTVQYMAAQQLRDTEF